MGKINPDFAALMLTIIEIDVTLGPYSQLAQAVKVRHCSQETDMLLKVLFKGRTLVVQSLVHTQVLLQPFTLFGRPSDGDDLGAFDFRDLADVRTDGTSSSGDDAGFAFFEFSDFEETLLCKT